MYFRDFCFSGEKVMEYIDFQKKVEELIVRIDYIRRLL